MSTKEEQSRLWNEQKKSRFYCKCGGYAYIHFKKDKDLCNKCRNYIFKDKEDEKVYKQKQFTKKMQELLSH